MKHILKTVTKIVASTITSIFILLALAIVGFFVFRSKPPLAPETVTNIDDIEAYIEELCESGSPPGLTLLIVKDGAIRYSRGFGLADGPNNLNTTPQTVFKWWSLTKIFTATAILQLQEQHKLNIDDPVIEYLPFFKVQYPSDNSTTVTIRHLLNHSSGLPDNIPEVLGWMHLENEPKLDQTALAKEVFPNYAKLKFEPGERSEYTNVGYMMLGAVIEAVSKQTYEDYVVAHLLKPLEINHTNFFYSSEMLPYAAVGSHPLVSLESAVLPFFYYDDLREYVREIVSGRMWFNPSLADSNPPTGLIGPATDLARYMMAYLNQGELEGTRILSAESINYMTNQGHIRSTKTIQAAAPVRGLGWAVYKDGEQPFYLEHSGNGPGFGSSMRLYPDLSLGLIVLANDTTYDREAILNLAAGLDW